MPKQLQSATGQWVRIEIRATPWLSSQIEASFQMALINADGTLSKSEFIRRILKRGLEQWQETQ